ncbi:MAG: bifunctional phosphopantothenoylcysteine decarboxylase/phosphopantothenate--cysteine ligase CoaBC [Gammaproteobacteria bacterium]|nr:bifunctional phosphopantothenoylcysteine decarboxylase/phosphopantothenate--cysteine ligase CoaBC [Gammaproteobacteria bacterium]
MKGLEQKRIILGVTGGIAAYKSAELVRRLMEQGADVQVVMTTAACEFITPLTFQALSGHPVRCESFDTSSEAAMSHIELARWADAVLVAPCSANTLAKIAGGIADNLLTTLILATDAPLLLAPAMNQQMWAQSTTAENVNSLAVKGIKILGPDIGEQACGDLGAGRMLEPDQLVDALIQSFQHLAFAGQRILITAGPTREAIDPVRFLSNRSSGKMGYALARAAREAGAAVTLISGPSVLATPAGIDVISVETAAEMHSAVMAHISKAGIFIGCAAVADYRLAEPASEKLKKQADSIQLTLVKNADILAEVAALPNPPFTVGFAAETSHLIENAREKLQRKHLNLIAANQVGDNQGFDQDDNELTVIWQDGQVELPSSSKNQLAKKLLEIIAQHYFQKSQPENNEKHPT